MGAALHEGYWIDVGGLRGDLRDWRRLEEDFLRGDPDLVDRVLSQQGPRLPASDVARRLEEQRAYASLNEARRVQLAVLRDREMSVASM